MLHGLQAGLLPTHDPVLQVCAAVRAVHSDPLRAALRVQASPGHRDVVLPVLPLRQWL
jgi:hypothetical protein